MTLNELIAAVPAHDYKGRAYFVGNDESDWQHVWPVRTDQRPYPFLQGGPCRKRKKSYAKPQAAAATV